MSKALLLLLPFISLACNAENFVLTKANDDLNRNLAAFNEQDDQCRKSAVVLPSDTFTGIQADKTQLKAALAYFYFKALHECSEAAVKEYLLSASVMAALTEPERAQSIHE